MRRALDRTASTLLRRPCDVRLAMRAVASPSLRGLHQHLERKKSRAASRTGTLQPPHRHMSSSVGGMQLPPFVDEVLRGVGQVIFLNSPACGALTLAALGYGDPWLCSLAAPSPCCRWKRS